MFDPAAASARMQPGDKMSMTFHKAQPKPGGPSFMDNAGAAGMVPAGNAAPAHMPQMSAVSRPAVPVDHRSMLIHALRRHMLGVR